MFPLPEQYFRAYVGQETARKSLYLVDKKCILLFQRLL